MSALGAEAVWGLPAALYVATVILYAQRTLGDGYDGVGFVLGVTDLDLSRFAPQPPGYPLFIALGRLGHACGLSPAVALGAASAVLLGAGIAAVAAAVRRAAGVYAGWLCGALLSLSPLCWALGVSTLSDGAALGVLLLAAYSFARGGPHAVRHSGLLLGIALGVRPTYAPLAGLLLLLLAAHGGGRAFLQASVYTSLAVLLWLIPFSLAVGPKTLWQLSRAHLQGHFELYGGALGSDPTFWGRLFSLCSGLLHASLGRFSAVALLLLLGSRWLLPPAKMPSSAYRLSRYLLTALFAYLGWALLALSIRFHGRHLLPAVTLLLIWIAVILGSAIESASSRCGRGVLTVCSALLVGLLGGSSAHTLTTFRQPSPGVRLAQYVAANYPKGTLLYGSSAARYLDLYWGSGSAHQTLYFGDIISEAERMNRLPKEVLLTSEVKSAARRRLDVIARFCFDPRLPRVLRFELYPSGCVELLSYRFLP